MLADYTIEPKAKGSGSYAWIYFGVRNSDSCEVAIKFSKESDATTLARFEIENRILRDLIDEENIINPITVVLQGLLDGKNRHYYVMEKADSDLDHWLDGAFGDSAITTKVDIIKQIYKTIKMIHEKGYIHRDLHLSNILVKTCGSIIVPKFSDFGRAYDSRRTERLSRINRPAWGELMQPPEIAFGVVDDPSSDAYKSGDIYAAGLIIKGMFTNGLTGCGELMSMHGSIKKFKYETTGASPDHYFSIRSNYEERLVDYTEWCKSEEEKFSRYSVELLNRKLSTGLDELIFQSSRLDYRLRETNIDRLIEILEGI